MYRIQHSWVKGYSTRTVVEPDAMLYYTLLQYCIQQVSNYQSSECCTVYSGISEEMTIWDQADDLGPGILSIVRRLSCLEVNYFSLQMHEEDSLKASYMFVVGKKINVVSWSLR